MAETIKAVKGFNQDMTCTPTKDIKFQYEEGKTYEEENANVCNKGFHACELPIDVFRYYPPVKSVYHEVEMSGTVDSSESDKICSTKIKIGAKINIAGIIKASIDIIRGKAEKESCRQLWELWQRRQLWVLWISKSRSSKFLCYCVGARVKGKWCKRITSCFSRVGIQWWKVLGRRNMEI